MNKKIKFWWLFLIISLWPFHFLLLPHLIEKFRQWQRTLIAESSCPVHLMWKMDPLVLPLATKLVIWHGPPIANFWWKLKFYFGASLWHKQCSEITCGFTFLSWLATPPSDQLSVLQNQKPESFSFSPLDWDCFFWAVRSVKVVFTLAMSSFSKQFQSTRNVFQRSLFYSQESYICDQSTGGDLTIIIIRIFVAPYVHAHGAFQLNFQDQKLSIKNDINNKTQINKSTN